MRTSSSGSGRAMARVAAGFFFALLPLLAQLPVKLVIPDSIGVNIHFTNPAAGEAKMLADAGFKWIRMDFAWGSTEREKGVYDFSRYDQLNTALRPYGIRGIFILDYSNRLYDEGVSPYTEAGRQAFAQWSAAAVRHFKGQGILWEMYNEPNIGFWKPKPNAHDYALLALAVGKALREAAPDEIYIGPATSRVDLPFIEESFRVGMLEYWSAVSVHPYRLTPPENTTEDYAALRALIAKYAPGKSIPIISGEWGYSALPGQHAPWKVLDEDSQGKYVAREFLGNIANGVPLSIWYDWHDDGAPVAAGQRDDSEHHFGVVKFAYYAGRDPVYDPKPGFTATKTLTTVLNGFTFEKRLDAGKPDDYVLVFRKGKQIGVAAWTLSAEPHHAQVPVERGRYKAVSYLGKDLGSLTAGGKGLDLDLSDGPQYLVK